MREAEERPQSRLRSNKLGISKRKIEESPENGIQQDDDHTGVFRQHFNADLVRLGADISQDRHQRIRVYAAMRRNTIRGVIEGWIDEYCIA